jgi:N-acylneuraminate cytidylyltransferase/CMP-N,N'-diacetyllegionaminic acid synthase
MPLASTTLAASSPRVLATICARGGSKGVRGKNVRALHGKPLLQYTIECVQRSARVGRFVFSTDSDEIAEVVRGLGYEVPYTRPAHLASDTAAKIDAIRDVTEFVERTDGFFPDIVVDLDIGVPLRDPSDVDRAIDALWQDDAMEAIVTVYRSERNPYFNMVEQQPDGYYGVVRKTAAPLVRRQDAPAVYSVTPAVFAWKRDKMHVTHLYEGRWGVVEVPVERSIDIDTEFEFQLVEHLMART